MSHRAKWVRTRAFLVAPFIALVVAAGLISPGVESASAVPEKETAVETAAAPASGTSMALAALNGSDFNPELIIADELFYDSSAMSAAEIQTFLDQKIGSCLTNRCLNVATVPVPNRAADYSVDTGGLICSAVTGGNLRVSELIFRAQSACGISAKVILVTLQKEQGLVTNRAPSDWALRAAMGMGCPDTAPCSDAFAGLAAQIVSGTRQLKAYKVGGFAKRPGAQYIQYHPDAGCGGTILNVRNYATAALYSYTPYQPDARALANLGGSGGSCSSYGNRNFWVFYNNWFGSTLYFNPLKSIADKYDSLGGATGVLGAPVGSEPTCASTASQCSRVYQQGIIAYFRGVGTFAAHGATGSYALSRLAVTGLPTSDVQAVTDPNGDGTAQRFQNGWVHSSLAGTFWSPTSVMTAYSAQGWLRGALGWPVAEISCGGPANFCVQAFAGGAISGLPGGAFAMLPKAVGKAYLDAGGVTGTLGYPVQAPQSVTDPNGNGTAQSYEYGWIHSSGNGAFVTSSVVMTEYSKRGWLRGSLGWPTGPETCDNTSCEQQFAGGPIRVTFGSLLANRAISDLWTSLGGASSSLGPPIGAVQNVVDPNGNGVAQQFQKGWIHSSGRGVFATPAAAMGEYSKQGWLRGWLGWPVGPYECTDNGCAQEFFGGTVLVSSSGYTRSVLAVSNPDIRAVHEALGGAAGVLGAAIAPAQAVQDPNGDGVAQRFENGWIHSSPRGTFATSARLMTGYSAAGWVRGSLGWPVGEERCTDRGCVQSFAGGDLFAPVNGTAFIVAPVTDPKIRALYDSIDGSAGLLGYAVAAASTVQDPNGDGVAQRFEYGWIHSSSLGTFWSSAEVMSAYSAAGWLRGHLGWPTSNTICVESSPMCAQTFAGGVISSSASLGSEVIPASIASTYLAEGGPGGRLGLPARLSQRVTDPNGNGSALQFQRGWIHASSRGSFASSNTIMSAYSSNGWVRGSLGWPTSGETCDSLGCVQSFAAGKLRFAYDNPASVIPAVDNANIRVVWESLGGGAGQLGYPVGPVQTVTDPNGNGFAQAFERGWIHSSAQGTFWTPSTLMQEYSASGWVRAPDGIGWPTGNAVCDAAGCTQAFTGGLLNQTFGGYLTNAAISSQWQSLGGASGVLGRPTNPVQVVTDPNGNGFAQQFERGWIHASDAGTYWSNPIIMNRYSSRGWVRGDLGWPIANPQFVSGGVTQAFRNGTLDSR